MSHLEKILKSKNMKRLLVFLWLALIFLGSSLPGAEVSSVSWIDFIAHKTIHLLEYGILAFLLVRLGGIEGLNDKKNIFLILFFCFIYGLSDEYHQSLVVGRDARVRDAFIDLLGATLGILVLWKLPLNLKKKLLN